MSKSTNMLRTRRRDNNVKPNRREARFTRLDRKSSRGMIYENEELRLKTININAEIERGQSDIKKLKRENEMLKKEIWCLRDEYDKLDKLLKDKKIDFSSSSTTGSSSDSESCSTCSEESEEVETSQNLENVQKTNLKNIHQDFDHLSVVPEEPSTENSDKSTRTSLPNCDLDIIPPDQSYPNPYSKSQTLPNEPKKPLNFFSPIKTSRSFDDNYFHPIQPGETYQNDFVSKKLVNTDAKTFYQNIMLVPKPPQEPEAATLQKTGTDLIVKTDGRGFSRLSESTFSNGGNLEELLNDIESISQDILRISNLQRNFAQPEEIQREDLTYFQNPVYDHLNHTNFEPEHLQTEEEKYKSELNVVLMPKSMPLIGFDKYKNIQRSFESLSNKPIEELSASQQDLCLISQEQLPETNQTEQTTNEPETNPFFFGNLKDNYVNSDYFNMRYNPDNYLAKDEQQSSPATPPTTSKTNHTEPNTENEENLKFKTTQIDTKPAKSPKLSIRRKVSIHFQGKKEKNDQKAEPRKHSIFDIKFTSSDKEKDKQKIVHQKTPSLESKKSTTETSANEPKTSSDEKNSEKRSRKKDKERKSVSVSPDRKHVHVKEEGKKHKKHKKSERGKNRRGTAASLDIRNRERSYSVCTDRSDHRYGGYMGSSFLFEDYSDRERTSMSSCETLNTTRKMSALSNVPLAEKVPWCGCWGNGCL